MTTFKRSLKAIILVLLFMTVSGTVGRAQEKPDPYTPLKLQVVISRYQGEKKLSSMPYTLSVNATADANRPGTANLRMGAKIPIAMMTFAPLKVDGKEIKDLPTGGGPVSWQYQDVGTNIDAFVHAMDSGRFRINLTVEDTSVYTDEQGKKAEQPTLRSFKATDSVILRDGQSSQFTAAADKVSGEVTRVEVTLQVIK